MIVDSLSVVRSPAELIDRYRAEGRRVTPQRAAIFSALHGNEAHPTAESVHALVASAMPMVSLRTVYSVLSELTEMGEILQLDLATGSARFDPHNAPHHHLVCSLCGDVFDVTVEGVPVRPRGDGVSGFEIDDTEIVFRGRCGRCASPGRA